ncbi:hypothetical protein [Sinorhizobium meliloti]|nr:hypothetical protein U8C39_33795 [Sinorhizobium meliloti]WQP20091.1 hypothetical protein U8C33_34490 [Sinorhizobium meliloti]WQP33527.1 hypothetical protein U8C45_33760 [Sinorhizobium meliloti]
MATITHVFTITHVAEMLGEDQELLEAIVSNSDNLHASSSWKGFERVIGCGHVSGLLCGSSTTAGRYGATRTWCKISSTSLVAH